MLNPSVRYLATGGSEGIVNLVDAAEWITIKAFDSYTCVPRSFATRIWRLTARPARKCAFSNSAGTVNLSPSLAMIDVSTSYVCLQVRQDLR